VRSLPLLSLVFLVAPTARAERPTTAVLWVGGEGGAEACARVDAVLAGADSAAPLADASVRPLLVDGGPATRVQRKTAAGRERFAALRDLPEADGLLADAEAIALAEIPAAAACAPLVEIARLRLRFAELTRDEPRARHAAWLLAACAGATVAAEDQAAIARHPAAGPVAQPDLRVESDPPGADVLLDLRPVGKTPLSLQGPRRAGALLDVELAGYRKVHRALDQQRGTLAVALARDDGLGALCDKVRAGADDSGASESDVAELARKLGAAQVLAVRGGAPGTLLVRSFATDKRAWSRPAQSIGNPPAPGQLDSAALLAYLGSPLPALPAASAAAAPAPRLSTAASAAAASVATAPGPPPPPAAPVPAYKRWYTWVIGGVLVGGIAAWLIAGQIGSDQITVHVEK